LAIGFVEDAQGRRFGQIPTLQSNRTALGIDLPTFIGPRVT
jgi:hypothetical protein